MEKVISLSGKARVVFKEIQLASIYRGNDTLLDLAPVDDPLEMEKQADAWRDAQDQKRAWQDETNRRK